MRAAKGVWTEGIGCVVCAFNMSALQPDVATTDCRVCCLPSLACRALGPTTDSKQQQLHSQLHQVEQQLVQQLQEVQHEVARKRVSASQRLPGFGAHESGGSGFGVQRVVFLWEGKAPSPAVVAVVVADLAA